MIQFLTSALGVSTAGFYLYVAVLFLRAELKSGASLDVAALKAATWPVTAWHTVGKLHRSWPTE